MKRFLLYIVLFMIPLVLLAIGIEAAVRSIPNSYKYKDTWMQKNGGAVETIILGNSLSYHGINPSCLKDAFNLANEGQRLEIDLFLLNKYLPICSNLKNIVLCINQVNLFQDEYESKREPTWQTLIYYGLYMGYPKHGPFSEYSYELTIPKQALTKAGRWCKSYVKGLPFDINCDSLGWNDSKDNVKKKDKNKMTKSYFELQSKLGLKVDLQKYHNNIEYLREIIQICSDHKLHLIVIQTPQIKDYLYSLDHEMIALVREVGKDLKSVPSVTYKDYSENSRFSLNSSYFFDGIHMGPEGANAFTEVIRKDFNL